MSPDLRRILRIFQFSGPFWGAIFAGIALKLGLLLLQ
jgi:hypothetical protein